MIGISVALRAFSAVLRLSSLTLIGYSLLRESVLEAARLGTARARFRGLEASLKLSNLRLPRLR